jgi:hypothetical protein
MSGEIAPAVVSASRCAYRRRAANDRQEAAYWRALFTRIAEDLEHAAGVERDPRRRLWFASRAMRIRQRLHDEVVPL